MAQKMLADVLQKDAPKECEKREAMDWFTLLGRGSKISYF